MAYISLPVVTLAGGDHSPNLYLRLKRQPSSAGQVDIGQADAHVHAHPCLLLSLLTHLYLQCHVMLAHNVFLHVWILYISTLLKLRFVAAFSSTTSRPTSHCFVDNCSGSDKSKLENTQNCPICPTSHGN